ncbi:MAG: ERCC4 domain-containing protein [Limisphaerales bacterium]
MLVIDTREQTPLPITRLPVVHAGLVTGDYSIRGAEDQFAVERKSIADLVSSITVQRSRFERELARLRGHEFRRLLIIGNREEIEQRRYHSRTSPAAGIPMQPTIGLLSPRAICCGSWTSGGGSRSEIAFALRGRRLLYSPMRTNGNLCVFILSFVILLLSLGCPNPVTPNSTAVPNASKVMQPIPERRMVNIRTNGIVTAMGLRRTTPPPWPNGNQLVYQFREAPLPGQMET